MPLRGATRRWPPGTISSHAVHFEPNGPIRDPDNHAATTHITKPRVTMPEQPTPSPIDPAALANLQTIAGGDLGFVAEIVQMFNEDTPPHLDELDSAAAAGDATRLAKVAHGLKGSASNFGAAYFRTLTERIEHLAKTGDLATAPAAIADLRNEYARVISALDSAVPKT